MIEGERHEGETDPRLSEAEDILDSLLARARGFAARAAALAREEVEDMVAEAKDLRQSDQA